jgi:tetratricopeptide (TPR) repeat protein
LVRVNGSTSLMKRLVYAGFGVIVETGLYDKKDGSWLGHYLTVIGWNRDEAGEFLYGLDSLENSGPDGLGVREYLGDMDRRWQHFNRLYIVFYRPDQESKLRTILDAAFDELPNAEEALAHALQEAQREPNNQFAWFNVGSSYVLLKQWAKATAAYDKARTVGGGLPRRFLWYQFGPYKAYYETGDFQDVINLASASLGTMGGNAWVEETVYYRGLAYASLGAMQQAIEDLTQAVQFNPNFSQAQAALSQLKAGAHPAPEMLL